MKSKRHRASSLSRADRSGLRLRIEILGASSKCELSERQIANLLRRACVAIAGHPALLAKSKRLLIESRSLQLAIVGRVQMQRLNGQFRGRASPTDILSFAPTEPGSLGELALCWPVIRAQARAHQLSLRAECYYMLLHGVLHLLGYDHELSEAHARRMFKIQDQLFSEKRL